MPDSISKAAASRTNEPPLVSVIVVNWNRAPYLDACLESVTRRPTLTSSSWWWTTAPPTAPRTRSAAGARKAGVRIFLLETNTGFTGGNNLAFRHARGDWLALLNNDAVADPHWLACLVARGNPAAGVGMLGGKILLAGTPGTIDKAGHLIWPDGQNRGRGTGETDRGQYDQEEEILWPDGCAALYHRALIEQTGGFDDAFFAYGDDADLGLRARLLGWRAWYVPGAVVHHHHSASAGAFSPLKIRLVERNRLLLALKDFPVGLLAQNPYWTLRRYLWLAWGAMRGSGTSGRFVREHSRFRPARHAGPGVRRRAPPAAPRAARAAAHPTEPAAVSQNSRRCCGGFRIDVRELTMGGDRP